MRVVKRVFYRRSPVRREESQIKRSMGERQGRMGLEETWL